MNELYHHGIKGQKWGVRRYQNPDGSLTAAGSRRRNSKSLFKPGKDGKPSTAERTLRSVSDAANTSKRLVKKTKPREDISSLSEQELKQRIYRLNLERQYRELTDNNLTSGRKRAYEILDTVGDVAGVAASLAAVGAALYKIKHG